MSSRREALIGRFRAMAVDRLVRVREGLERARRAPTPEALTEALGELPAEASGKRVRFVLEASGAQLERPVLEGLSEPLLHLLRNAIDHGVEPPEERGDKPAEATVRLSAESSGASVTIAIEDDGRGLSAEGIRAAAVERGLLSADAAAALSDERVHALIFEPGLSTSRGISEISGRGVGLDVVRRRVDALGGTVRVDSFEGAGTRFELVVPATVTRERFIVVDVSGVLYGIPARRVSSIASAAETREDEVAGGRVVRSGEAWVKLRDLAADLGEEMQATPNDRLLFVDEGEERFAWRVPSVLGERELIRHALDPVLDEASFLAGSAMLDDGRLVLLLHVNEVIRRSGVTQRPRLVPGESRIAPRVLVADDSPIIRDLLAELLRDAGLEVETAVDGRDALERVDVRAPDLVVTDLEMPRVDGFGLVEGIRRRGLQIPIIVVSTRGSVEDRRRASEAGANAYVVKTGFEGSTLLETIAKFVEVRR